MKDKSPQGHYDKDIIPLLKKINSHKEYVTTSSCSGRIVVLNSQKKGNSKWLFKSHSKVRLNDIYNTLPEDKDVWFMQEPLILHIKCSSLESASKLVNKLKASGLKVTGITSLKTNLVEVRGSKRIETILNKSLNNKEYLKLLIEKANEKLMQTKEEIKKLEQLF
ncbi:hypothetical protein D6777_02390 [Candidatus Woesearchaeota archaeon]|nr:MAG: hypothetical protein D6777_02390 [Candidatus Woesearchaeota archaeon]